MIYVKENVKSRDIHVYISMGEYPVGKRNWGKCRKEESHEYTNQEKYKRSSYVMCDFKAVINNSNKEKILLDTEMRKPWIDNLRD